MAESVTVDHGGTSITTNTASEADLRAEMTAPEAAPAAAPDAPRDAAAKAARARDGQGRYAPKGEAAAPAAPQDIAPPENVPPPDAHGRRRDDALPRHNPIARMNQALAQKAEAERYAAALEAEVVRLRGGTGPPPAAAAVPAPAPTNGHAEPQFEQFADAPDPYTAYMQAWARWDRGQALAQARAEWEAAQAAQAKAATFKTALDTGRTAFPDFDNVLQNADTLGLQVSAVMAEAIGASPKAADLVYYLATHPEECLQLAEESQQTPVAAAAVMRRLLESHLAPRAVPSAVTSTGSGAAARAVVSTAKPPVTPVGSSPVVSDEPPGESASAAEHARYWNRRLKVPGTR